MHCDAENRCELSIDDRRAKNLKSINVLLFRIILSTRTPNDEVSLQVFIPRDALATKKRWPAIICRCSRKIRARKLQAEALAIHEDTAKPSGLCT